MDYNGGGGRSGGGHEHGRRGGRGDHGGNRGRGGRYRPRQPPTNNAFQRGIIEERDPTERERFLKLLFDLGKGPNMEVPDELRRI